MKEETEERASLYIFGLLEGKEVGDFEMQIHSNGELRTLVDELDETAAQFAHTAPLHPLSPGLRSQVLSRTPKRKAIQIRPLQTWIPWAIAAALALTVSYLVSEQNHLRHRITRLEARDFFAEIQVAPLHSKMAGAPDASAVVVWNEKRQRGLLQISELPANEADRDYELWLIDPRYPQPVNGGVFHVSNSEFRQIAFQPAEPVREAKGFAISLERKGGVAKAEGPIVLAR
jgi:anti-sigma-K factor RskA